MESVLEMALVPEASTIIETESLHAQVGNAEPVEMKRCNRCTQSKPATSEYFNRDTTKVDGWRTICRECRRISRPSEANPKTREVRPPADPAARARAKAIRRLIENHSGEFSRLVRSEMASAGLIKPQWGQPKWRNDEHDGLTAIDPGMVVARSVLA